MRFLMPIILVLFASLLGCGDPNSLSMNYADGGGLKAGDAGGSPVKPVNLLHFCDDKTPCPPVNGVSPPCVRRENAPGEPGFCSVPCEMGCPLGTICDARTDYCVAYGTLMVGASCSVSSATEKACWKGQSCAPLPSDPRWQCRLLSPVGGAFGDPCVATGQGYIGCHDGLCVNGICTRTCGDGYCPAALPRCVMSDTSAVDDQGKVYTPKICVK